MKTAPAPIPITHAEGVYLYTAEGSRLLDGVSSWWVNIHGHNHPRLNRALTRQAEQMAHVIFAGLTHEPGARLAQALVECTPGNLPHVFYTDDGSTAVEAALKMAHQHWRLRGETKRNTFVAIENGYHYVLNLDADFSHHPRYLPALIHGMSENGSPEVDVMIGSRYV
ncbi:MAG: aminotransferase class III-fold pyridoxal phosphate-dependent enzyme, partial [Planctomycetes bacterium]|nr:aminotransferase class III-fold pyridoxal phosphate-dependent enzyme [Planctomycetota bacterium]